MSNKSLSEAWRHAHCVCRLLFPPQYIYIYIFYLLLLLFILLWKTTHNYWFVQYWQATFTFLNENVKKKTIEVSILITYHLSSGSISLFHLFLCFSQQSAIISLCHCRSLVLFLCRPLRCDGFRPWLSSDNVFSSCLHILPFRCLLSTDRGQSQPGDTS